MRMPVVLAFYDTNSATLKKPLIGFVKRVWQLLQNVRAVMFHKAQWNCIHTAADA